MNAMACQALQNVAGELALDLLSAEERAAALDHLATCPACRLEVTSLGGAVDELLVLVPEVEPSSGFVGRVLAEIEARMLVPEVEPPAGFEQRVLARMTGPTTATAARRPRRRVGLLLRRTLVTAAAAALLGVAAAGLIATTRSDTAEVTARTAPMRSAAGSVVGDVALTADPATVVLRVDDWIELVRSYGGMVDAPSWLAVETVTGSRDLYRLPAADDHPWTVAIDTDPTAVVAVSIVDNGGTVWCTADLTS